MTRLYLHESVRCARAMTVAIGIRCDEGILLLADRQITKEGGLKYYEKKIREVSGGLPKGFFNIGFAYAGFPEAAKFVVGDVEERVSREDASKLTVATLKRCVQQSLELWWKEHKKQTELELLISIFVWGQGSKLLRSRGKLMVDSEFDCLGVGDSSVVRYFIETFVKDRFGLHHLLPLCVYVMEQAKKYMSNCGGKTDVLCIAEDRTVCRPNPEGIEQDNERVVRDFQHLFEAFYDPRTTDAMLSKDLQLVRKNALALRHKLESHFALRFLTEGHK